MPYNLPYNPLWTKEQEYAFWLYLWRSYFSYRNRKKGWV